ncbi:MAG: hypothetical protein JWO13_276 [Acidobacteriales bacterium]|nr:hypothetical protein [Terriglobales bacterium]
MLAGVCLFCVVAVGQSCQETTVSGYVKRGEGYSLAVGSDLEVRLVPMKDDWGWLIEAGPLGSPQDWAWVTNPPYHSGNSQLLGTGYGENARDQLKRPHQVRFVLNKADYDWMSELVEEQQKNSKAVGPLLSALSEVKTASAVVSAVDYEREGDPKQVRWMRFSLKVSVAPSFARSKALKWVKGACPARAR